MFEHILPIQRGTPGVCSILRPSSKGGFEALNLLYGWSHLAIKSGGSNTGVPVVDTRELQEGGFALEHLFDGVLLPMSILSSEERPQLLAATEGSEVFVVIFRAGIPQELSRFLAELEHRNAASPSR
ncbi:MAG: hypothetical protein KBD16_02630 [Candidatus Pacebacteria bacterium]|nr:hypothetical protein [Candidatus Paceibacterota bacterium]